MLCCNGYSYAIFTIFFYESQVKYLRKAYTKEKKRKKSDYDYFIAVQLHFYDLDYLNLTKIRLSNKKSGKMLEVNLILNLKINIVTKF